MAKEKKIINGEDFAKILSAIYEKTKDGIPYVSKPVDQVAQEYLKKYHDKETACKKMLTAQIAKCATSGFVAGFGGVVAMPVMIPANLSSVLYVQMRMIACAASMGGYDLDDDEVQTFVYACLAGVSVNQIVKKFGVKFGEKLALEGVKKIPGKVLIMINQRIGFRLFTKFGEKGLINIGKMIPVVGAVINGGFDLAETKLIANRAYKMFIKNDFTVGKTWETEAEVLEDSDAEVGASVEDTAETVTEPDVVGKEAEVSDDFFESADDIGGVADSPRVNVE